MDLSRPLATVTPTVDGDVLAVLAASDATFTVGQVHRLMRRHSVEGLRKVLQRLAAQGVVLADQIGRAYAYRLNRDHLAAEHIIGLARLRTTFLERLEQRLTSWAAQPVYAAVFGSVARGSSTVDSDVDLILVRRGDIDVELWDRQVHDLATDVTRWTGNDARPLEFTVAELAARARDEPVLRDVVRDGIAVAGKHAWLVRQLRQGSG